MQVIELYRYVEEDNSIIVTPNRRNDKDLIHKYRLIADEDKTLFDGANYAPVVDVVENDIDKWVEVDIPLEEIEVM